MENTAYASVFKLFYPTIKISILHFQILELYLLYDQCLYFQGMLIE